MTKPEDPRPKEEEEEVTTTLIKLIDMCFYCGEQSDKCQCELTTGF